jgi:hypothetical protein
LYSNDDCADYIQRPNANAEQVLIEFYEAIDQYDERPGYKVSFETGSRLVRAERAAYKVGRELAERKKRCEAKKKGDEEVDIEIPPKEWKGTAEEWRAFLYVQHPPKKEDSDE